MLSVEHRFFYFLFDTLFVIIVANAIDILETDVLFTSSLSTHSNDDGVIDTSIYRYVDNIPRAVTHDNYDEFIQSIIFDFFYYCSDVIISFVNFCYASVGV